MLHSLNLGTNKCPEKKSTSKNNDNNHKDYKIFKGQDNNRIFENTEVFDENNRIFEQEEDINNINKHTNHHQSMRGCICHIQVKTPFGLKEPSVPLYVRKDNHRNSGVFNTYNIDYGVKYESFYEPKIPQPSLVEKDRNESTNEKCNYNYKTRFNFCSTNLCFHGGECLEGWKKSSCDCSRTGFYGNQCLHCSFIQLLHYITINSLKFIPMFRFVIKIYYVNVF